MTQTPALAPTQPPPGSTPDQPQYTITEEDKARKRHIQEAWKAYDGELEKPLQPMENSPDDNVLENQCGPIVDSGVAFLFGLELEISVDEDAPQEAQDFLNGVWGRKEKRIPLLQDAAYNGAMAGNPFLRIVPGKQSGTFRLINVDPAIINVKAAPQDCEIVLLYHLEYSETQQVNGKDQNVYYCEEIALNDPDDDEADQGDNEMADVDASWTIQHWTRVGEKEDWTPAGEPITWSWPFPPLFTCKNLPRPNSFWGRPDITPDIIGLNNALNLNESNINRIGKIYGSPILTATGVGDATIDVKPGVVTTLPNPESKITAVAIASDVPNMLSFSENLRSNADEVSGVPGVATGRLSAMPRGDMSGVAIELLFVSLVKKTQGKQCRYGEMIIDVSKALLILNGMSGDIDILLAWQDPMPHSDLPSVQSAVQKLGIGISKSTLQRELGYDPDEEAALSQAEAEATLTNYSRGVGLPPAAPIQPGQAPQQAQPAAPPAPESPFIGGGRQ
ncbi:MAG: phage portal protein [Ktedonobacteraceae bacterium]